MYKQTNGPIFNTFKPSTSKNNTKSTSILTNFSIYIHKVNQQYVYKL